MAERSGGRGGGLITHFHLLKDWRGGAYQRGRVSVRQVCLFIALFY